MSKLLQIDGLPVIDARRPTTKAARAVKPRKKRAAPHVVTDVRGGPA